jgi:predicted Rossmann-fold nucleotide-binding protein
LIVILPGGGGTLSELKLAWEYNKPILVFLGSEGSVGGKSAKQIEADFRRSYGCPYRR